MLRRNYYQLNFITPSSAKKLIGFLLFSVLLLPCSAQRYNTWYFGEAAGLKFNSGGSGPLALTDGVEKLSEGIAAISDMNGNLLFYTNGSKVFTQNHRVMMNGGDLSGHWSAIQACVIVPAPRNDSLYYIFTTDANENGFVNGYRYSVVDMKRDGGKGAVVIKNILLNTSCSEMLTAARHANGIDVWVIGHELGSNVYKAWLVTCAGVESTSIVSIVGNIVTPTYGSLRVSPDGTLICQTSYPHTVGSGFFQVFDFDNATGKLSNAKIITNLFTNSGAYAHTGYYTCEFSPDSKLLYGTFGVGNSVAVIDQFEVKLPTAAAIDASRVSIPAGSTLSGIQRGPDGKIYISRSRRFLSVISQPNVKGIGCVFELDKISLASRNSIFGLPVLINDGYTNNPPVTPPFTIQTSPSTQTINPGESVPLNVTGGSGSVQWIPPLWLSDPNIRNPVATPQNDITYFAVVTNEVGCKAMDSVVIDVNIPVDPPVNPPVNPYDSIYVPTGFTPDDDGRNDLFKPIIGNGYKLEEFSVYNRWGQKVFSTREHGKGWDGRISGQKQNSGIYVWFLRAINPANNRIEKKGNVMLIR